MADGNWRPIRRYPTLIRTLVLILLLSPVAFAQSANKNLGDIQLASLIEDEKRPRVPITLPYIEPLKSSWALAMDNDMLALLDRDQDYTYGINFTYTGSRAKDLWVSLDKPLGGIDRLLQVDDYSGQGVHTHHFEVGLFGFTPDDIKLATAIADDRPYAGLVYISSAREQLDLMGKTALKTTLTLGVLGSNVVGEAQNSVHTLLGGKEAKGWHNQISDGGELTARYSIARQDYLGRLFDNLEIKSTLQASAGYLTEVSWSLSMRSGQYHTLWSSFNPELASYGEKSSYTTSGDAVREHYFWAGMSVKARIYNAFLQGQFRHSDVTYDRSELNPVLVEAWAGYTFAFNNGYRISYVLRGHTSEIKEGAGDRSLVWGGLILAKTFH